jgi:hypothetical protein
MTVLKLLNVVKIVILSVKDLYIVVMDHNKST